jgi:hypothetical protein
MKPTPTPTPAPAPTPTPTAAAAAGQVTALPRLAGLYEDIAARLGHPTRWTALPLTTRGAVRAMWAAVRAGQTDPWPVALAGWRHRATWYRRTYRSAVTTPDPDDPDTWADHRAQTRDRDHDIAGQYLTCAAHLITAHTHQNPVPDTTPRRPTPPLTSPTGTEGITT